VEHHLAAGQGDAGRQRLERGLAGRAHGRRPRQHRVHATPGEPREVRDAAAELAHVHLCGALVGQVQPGGELRPRLGGDPVRGPAGTLVQPVAHVEQRQPAPLQVAVRYVDQPGGHQRLEDGGIAQPALGLLQVRHREMRQLADQAVPVAHQPMQLGQPLPRRAPPLRQHRRAQPQREVGVAGEVPHVEQPGGDPDVGTRGRNHLRQRAHGVVELRAGVPDRVPHLLPELAELDDLVVHQHHVEVAVRRQLGPPVAPDRDQRRADLEPAAAVVRRRAELVRLRGAGGSVGGGHGASANTTDVSEV
jgi:hypothetical protein